MVEVFNTCLVAYAWGETAYQAKVCLQGKHWCWWNVDRI